MSKLKLTSEELISIVSESLRAELQSLKDNLTDEQKKCMKEAIVGLAEERLALALADTDAKKKEHRANAQHYESAVKSLIGVVHIKAYDSALSLTGRILGKIALAAGKAIIA